MRKLISYILVFMCFVSSIQAAPPSYEEEDETPGNFFNGAKYDSNTYSSVGISMITWGLGIAAGIAALTLLIDQSAGGSKGSSTHTTCPSCSHCHS